MTSQNKQVLVSIHTKLERKQKITIKIWAHENSWKNSNEAEGNYNITLQPKLNVIKQAFVFM